MPVLLMGTLQESSLNELLGGRHNLNDEMSERTGQLKALVSIRSGCTVALGSSGLSLSCLPPMLLPHHDC